MCLYFPKKCDSVTVGLLFNEFYEIDRHTPLCQRCVMAHFQKKQSKLQP